MVYKYKDKSDAAKVHSAPATGRRVSYSRTDNKTYRNTVTGIITKTVKYRITREWRLMNMAGGMLQTVK